MECLLKDKCFGRDWGCVCVVYYFCQQRTSEVLQDTLSQIQLIYHGIYKNGYFGSIEREDV